MSRSKQPAQSAPTTVLGAQPAKVTAVSIEGEAVSIEVDKLT
jgi:hypothetical protein